MNSTVKVVLQELKLKSTNEWVFPRSNRWEKGLQAKTLNKFQEECGVKKTKFHALRAFFITQLLRTGCSAIYVQEIVGHQDIKTTMFYVGLAGTELKGKTEALANIGRNHVPKIVELEEERRKREEKKGS